MGAIAIPENFTYTKRYYSHFAEMAKAGFAALGKAVFGRIFGECSWKQTCEETYPEMAKVLNCSRSSVARWVKRLNEKGLIKRLNGTRSEYKTDESTKASDGFIITPSFFYTTEFTFKSGARYLRQNEIDVASYILSWSLNPKTKGYKGSMGNIARTLGISTSTASEAIEALIETSLIRREETPDVLNGAAIFKYTADKDLVIAIRKAFRKNGKEEKLPENVRQINEKAERESYYSKLRAEAEREAEKRSRPLRLDGKYAAAFRERRKLDVAENKEHDAGKLQEIKKRREILWNTITDRALAFGFSETELSELGEVLPRYKCRKCSDMGTKPDGTYCDCYPEWRKRLKDIDFAAGVKSGQIG